VAKHRLGSEIAAVLLAKVAALTLLYFTFFDAARRPHMSPDVMATKLLGSDIRR
jgi:hypothetical protein